MWRVVEGRASSSGKSLTFCASYVVNLRISRGGGRLLIVDKKVGKTDNFKGFDGNRSRRQESEGGAALSKNISMILEAGTNFRFYLLIVVFRGRKNNAN